MLDILAKLMKRANKGAAQLSAADRRHEAASFLLASSVAEPAGVVRRQLVALALALAIFAAVVGCYCSVTVPEAWEDAGRLQPSGIVFDAEHLTNEAMARLDDSLTRVRAPSTFSACDIVVYATEEAAAARDEVAEWGASFRTSLLKHSSRTAPAVGGDDAEPMRCRSAISVQLRAATVASSAAATTLTTHVASSEHAPLGHVNGRLTLTILLQSIPPSSGADGNDAPRCAGRVIHSRAAHVFCSVNAAVASAADAAVAVANRVRIERGPALPLPSHLLRRVAKHYNDVPSSMAGLVEEMVMDSVGPKDAAELRDSIEHHLPAAAPQLATPGWALQRALRRSRQRGGSRQAAADAEEMAAAVLADPHWTTALLLPPEQLLALHMPIYLPLTVSLFGACRVLLRKAIAARRRRRKAAAAAKEKAG